MLQHLTHDLKIHFTSFTLHIIYLFTVVAFHAYVIMCSIFSLVVVLGLYVIDYNSLSSYELNFVMNFLYRIFG